jgi:fluoride ion exporter CrcB/FEX
MVEMMDGTDTIYHPQVGAAIFGYVIGVACAICCYISGIHAFQCLKQFYPSPQPFVESVGRIDSYEQEQEKIITSTASLKIWGCALLLVCTGLVSTFIFMDIIDGSLMYRELWLSSLMSPFGALLRWLLSTLNTRPTCGKKIRWFPWGTFIANFAASMICIFGTAMKTYVVDPQELSSVWVLPVLVALVSGFAGSLSTTSALVHEITNMDTLYKSYSYAVATIICSMLVSLLIYIPIARFW